MLYRDGDMVALAAFVTGGGRHFFGQSVALRRIKRPAVPDNQIPPGRRDSAACENDASRSTGVRLLH
jgi:hypothetical protein